MTVYHGLPGPAYPGNNTPSLSRSIRDLNVTFVIGSLLFRNLSRQMCGKIRPEIRSLLSLTRRI
jgi:hypothetical protein